MNTPLEEQLRATLTREADRGPILQVMATSPVRHRRPFRLAVAGATVVAAVVVGAVTLGSSSGTAIAGWTSTPNPVSPAVTAALAKACGIADPLIADVRGRAGFVVGKPSPGSPGADIRGAAIDCLINVPGDKPDEDLRSGWLSGELASSVTAATPADPLVVLSAKSPEGNSVHQHDITWVSGVVDASVAKVAVQTPSGLVTATVAGGRFAAWWPGNDGDVDVVRAYAADGSLLASADQLNCDAGGLFSPRVTLPGQQPTGGCTGG